MSLRRPRCGLAALCTAILVCLAAEASAAEPKAVVEGIADKALRAELARAIGEVKTKSQSAFEARRRAREAAVDAVALLRSEGYYLPTVEPAASADEPPRAIVRIQTGPRFRIAQPAVHWRAAQPDPKASAAALSALALAAGTPGRAADILAAEGRAVAAVQKLGYADARAAPREVVVDDADLTVRPTFQIAAGGLVRLGDVEVITKGRTNPAWVRGLVSWRKGDIYDPAKVAKLERRLLDVGVYQSVTVALAPADKTVEGLRPVIVDVADRRRNTIELGAGYSTAPLYYTEVGALSGDLDGQGSGVDGKWITYNRLGLGDTLTLTGQVYDIQQKLDLGLDLPGWGRPDQILKVGGGYTADETPAFSDSDVGVRLIVERDFTKTTFITYGGALDYTGTREESAVNLEAIPVGENLRLFIVTGVAGFGLDRSNDILNPTRGWRVQVRLEPTFITGDETLGYLKAVAQASAYQPLDSSSATVLAERLRLGSILGGELPGVPAERRFYAGGGGSVRGYAYQDVGPQLENGTPAGGLSLLESSFEVRRRITDQWGVVAFVDAGSVGETPAPVVKGLSTGVGVGVRYNLGFGPFRFDIATPIDPRKGDGPIQVYVSIGQSF